MLCRPQHPLDQDFALPFGPAHHRLQAAGTLRATLRAWLVDNAPQAAWRPTTVELGCLYELADGQRGSVQRTGESYGAFERPPYLRLGRDERAWTAPGQNLFINLDRANQLRRLLLFVYTCHASLATSRFNLELHGADAPFRIAPWRIPGGTRLCTLAMITPVGDRRILVHRQVRCFRGFQQQIDRAHHVEASWTRQPTTM